MKNMIIILLVCIIIWIIYEINNLISLKKKVERAESVVDVFLKKRFDLIPNLVETVKGYVQYEQDTLQNIIVTRNNYMNTHSIEDGKKLTEDYKKVLAIAEALPTLKASENFLNLQNNIPSPNIFKQEPCLCTAFVVIIPLQSEKHNLYL